MIVVTGATGNVGRPLVGLLHAAGAPVRAVTRDARTADLPTGVEIVEGDPSRPATVAAALHGATGLFLNPQAVGDGYGELLHLAAESGVKRVVMLSGQAVDAETQAIEDAITGSGLDHVLLRPGMFATGALLLWSGQIRAGDVVKGPYGKAAQAPIDPRDLAAVAAHAFVTDELLGREPRLTGPESLTQEQMVATIGEAIGRPLRYEEISPEAAKAGMAVFGYPESMIDDFLAILAESVGRPAYTTTEVADILRRPARTYRTWAADNAGAFQRSDH